MLFLQLMLPVLWEVALSNALTDAAIFPNLFTNYFWG